MRFWIDDGQDLWENPYRANTAREALELAARDTRLPVPSPEEGTLHVTLRARPVCEHEDYDGAPAGRCDACEALILEQDWAIDPDEPRCKQTADGEHDWGAETTWGKGGGVIVARTCQACGLEHTIDTDAYDHRGNRGLRTERWT